MSGTREEPCRDVLDYVSRYLRNKDLFVTYVSIKTQQIGLNTDITLPRLNTKVCLTVFLVLKILPNTELMEKIHEVLKGVSWYTDTVNSTGNIFLVEEYS